MALDALEPGFRSSLRGLERAIVRAGVSADQLTATGAGCALAAAVSP